MLAILTTHPIQYQVPLWQALARDGRVPFEVWYLTRHGVGASHDREFGKSFAWDLDMLSGYPHRFLDVQPGATPNTFWRCRTRESLAERLRASGAKALWVQGWQVAAYWQAVWAAKRAGIEVWLRAESNDLAPVPLWKRGIKRLILGQLFRRVDRFLYIGAANKRLYQKFGVPGSRLYPAPYAVDNERFARQADQSRKQKADIRKNWRIPEDAFCVLFCGKFIPKKRPLDLVAAASLLLKNRRSKMEARGMHSTPHPSPHPQPLSHPMEEGRVGLSPVEAQRGSAISDPPRIHLLFVGSGEMGPELRARCTVVFDAEGLAEKLNSGNLKAESKDGAASGSPPPASFAGFLNQTEISRAYVAADCLVLPSDYGETWGLVVNEAMASGLRCIISEQCGCAEELGAGPNAVFPCGGTEVLADRLAEMAGRWRGSARGG